MWFGYVLKRCYSENNNSFKTLLEEIKTNSTIEKNDPLMKLLFNKETSNSTLSKQSDLKHHPSKHSAQLAIDNFNFKDKGFEIKKENVKNKLAKYKAHKDEQKSSQHEQDEDVTFRQLYAERFTPIGSFEKMDSLVEQKIEDYFKNDKSKSKQKDSELLLNKNPYIDETEFHLNNMLKTQNCKPEWIKQQNILDEVIANFKKRLATSYFERVKKDKSATVSNNQNMLDTKTFEDLKQDFNSEFIEINSQIRDYNLSLLQLSSSLCHLHKWKMKWDTLEADTIKKLNIQNATVDNTLHENKNDLTESPKKPWYFNIF